MFKICLPLWKSFFPLFYFLFCLFFFRSLLFITPHIYLPKMQQQDVQKSCCILRIHKPFWRAFQPTIFHCLYWDSAFLKLLLRLGKIVCIKNPQNTTLDSRVQLSRAVHNPSYSGECRQCAQSTTNLYRHTQKVCKKGEVSITPLTEGIISVMHDATWLKRPLPKSLCMLHQRCMYYLHIR